MSSLLSTFSCCWFWLLAGLLLGWLLNWWLCKCTCRSSHQSLSSSTAIPSTAATKQAETSTPTTPKPKSITIDLVAAKAAGFTIKNTHDLTVIEGIGPKISQLFNDNGITSFDDLAKQSISQMRAILDKGGSRFRIANPETWAQQAALAADNKWTELKKLQSKLSGGVKK
jgi:predicted flap endonuclease-1-like 5' DNA nuclease